MLNCIMCAVKVAESRCDNGLDLLKVLMKVSFLFLQSHGVLERAVSGVVGTAKGLARSVGRVGASALSGARAAFSFAGRRLQQKQPQEDLSMVSIVSLIIICSLMPCSTYD